MRFSVVYESDNKRWAIIDQLTSDDPIKYFDTEWDALNIAQSEECLWRTNQLSRPRLN